MTSFQRASLWLVILLLLMAGDTALLFFLSHRGLGPLGLTAIGASVPILFLMGINMAVPTRCSNCRLQMGFPRRIAELVRGRAIAPYCPRCR